MAIPSATFTEMVTTTLRNHPNEVADNVSDHNAFYRRLRDRNQIKLLDGGYEIVRPLDYAENSTFQRYSGFDTLNVGASDVLTSAKYDWVQSAVHVTASGLELRKNSGKEQMINLVRARVKNALRTAANNMSVDLYGTGALTNQMGGLGHIIQTDGNGTVGGINSATFSFWANQFFEAAGTGQSKSSIKTAMNVIWLQCVRGNDKPDLIMSSNDFYGFFWESLQDLQRYGNSNEQAVAGFQSLKYNTADVVHDTNTNFGTTAEKMYFLNTNFLEMVSHRAANWSQLAEKVPTNQDAVLIPIIWQGQLVCSNRSLQGVLIDAA